MTQTTNAAASSPSISTPAQREPKSAVAVCCRHSAMMLALADEGGRTRAELASFRELNKKQARLLNEAAGIADEMLEALRLAEIVSRCDTCGGYGTVTSSSDELDECPACHGNYTVITARVRSAIAKAEA